MQRRLIFTNALLIVIGIFLMTPSPLPPIVGSGDFRPYWTSAYLLTHGQDFSDPEKIYDIEHRLAGWDKPFPMFAWFAPTGNIVLLPYTLLDFARATYYWFLTNILLICWSMLLLWPRRNTLWIPFVAAFAFSITLLTLEGGQVNTLVLLGLALYLVLSQDPRRGCLAGASLVLTTVKAHLVILTLPLLLLEIVWRKQWRVLIGFVGTLIGCLLILQIFYADWPMASYRLISGAMGFYRLTPTLPGLLIAIGQGRWAKWLWVPALVCAIGIWWRFRDQVDRRSLVDLSLLAGTIISPVGWSYDQIVLLIPIVHILQRTTNDSLSRTDRVAIALLLAAADAITYYQRVIVNGSEAWYFWVPLFVVIVYIVARQRQLRFIPASASAAT